MKLALKLATFLLLSALLASCAALQRSRSAPPVQATNTISGNVTYLQRMALPDSAIVNVVLQDQANGKAVPGASQTAKTEGQQAPFPFELDYDPAQLDKSHAYALAATISVDGQVIFATKDPVVVNVFSGAPISGIELVLEPVQGSAGAGARPQASPLAGTDWQLGAVDANGATTTPVQGTTITLNFGNNGSVMGSAGCNDYSGSYRTAEGDQIIFSNLVTTRKACTEPVMKQEDDYLKLLQTGGTYNLRGDPRLDRGLTLTLNQGKTLLNFETPGSNAVATPAMSPLAGTKWQLGSIESFGASGDMAQGATITLNFDAGPPRTRGQLSGSDGCNQYSGSYTTNGDNITIGPLASTLKACDEAVMKQAGAYMQILQKASQYQLGNEQLTLMADGGQQVLHYTWVP